MKKVQNKRIAFIYITLTILLGVYFVLISAGVIERSETLPKYAWGIALIGATGVFIFSVVSRYLKQKNA